MPYLFPKNQFDPHHFINSLIKDLGLEHAEPAKLELLKKQIERQMEQVVLDMALLYLESDLVDELSEECKKEIDPVYFIQKLIRYSPETQWQILNTLNDFYDTTVHALKNMKKQPITH